MTQMTPREVRRMLYKIDRQEGGTTLPFDEWLREYDGMIAQRERWQTIADFEHGELEPQGRMQ